MNTAPTADALALQILLSKSAPKVKQDRLKGLLSAVEGRIECRECGDHGPHEDNLRGEYVCRACGLLID